MFGNIELPGAENVQKLHRIVAGPVLANCAMPRQTGAIACGWQQFPARSRDNSQDFSLKTPKK